ncbi:HNH endonuclease [Pseudomonas inefficax]|nr:HNH endonuclease [Pseudomonas inefficax]MEE1906710.1 HNH endonuclease [Pseudomonas inefficax]MEE1983270.1 HNH endonuclease [Pseudomonas inefficax]
MKPITFTGADSTFVNSYDGVNHGLWNSTKGPIVALRASIRTHYLEEQGYMCAYCRMLKREKHGLSWDVEHIIPKSEYPRFLFEPENLALACKECNLSKHDKNVLTRPLGDKAVYPTDRDSFTIIHPHYDTYSEHMEVAVIAGKVFHRPKNKEKGKETFIMCDLIRFSYEYGEWKDFSYGITKEVNDFLNKCPPDATPQEISRFLGMLSFTVNADFAPQ